MDLLRKTVIVTGASTGIGRATALAFGRAGANVVVAARSKEKLEGLVSEIEGRYGVPALAIPTDVTKEDEVQALIGRAYTHFNSIDILVNNAGRGMTGPLATSPINQMREVMELNWWGVIYGVQAALPYMRRQGYGLIMNVSTMAVFAPLPFNSVYVASKAAVSALSRILRDEVEPYGILVSTVYPGLTATEFDKNVLTAENSRNMQTKQKGKLAQLLTVPAAQVALKIVQAAQRDRVPHDVFATNAERLVTLPIRLFDGIIDSVLSRYYARLREEYEYAHREA